MTKTKKGPFKLSRIYLDHNSGTPIDPRVIKEVEKFLSQHIGNPSSIHSFGRECRQILTKSRDTIAEYLKVRSDELIFTSGGTEGANLILRGLFQKDYQGHIITSTVEHDCVYETIQQLEKRGCEITYLEPGEWGAIRPEAVKESIRPDTKLIAIMAVNNETGVETDIDGIAKIASNANIPFFVDAVALLGKKSFSIPEGVSAMCFSGQKIHALQGSGFCFIRRGLRLAPILTGGEQQYGIRAGTENLPGIVALAKALELIQEELPAAEKNMFALKLFLENELKDRISDVKINGLGNRISNTSNLSFTGVDAETLLMMLDREGIAVSHGSACASGALEPSRVLRNMGLPLDQVNSSIRISLSRFTTKEEIEMAISIIEKIVKQLKNF